MHSLTVLPRSLRRSIAIANYDDGFNKFRAGRFSRGKEEIKAKATGPRTPKKGAVVVEMKSITH